MDEFERLAFEEVDDPGFLRLRPTEFAVAVKRFDGRIFDARKLDRVASPRKTDKKKLCGKNESPP